MVTLFLSGEIFLNINWFLRLSILFFFLESLSIQYGISALALGQVWQSRKQNKEESIQGFWITTAKALRELERTAMHKQWIREDFVGGAPQPGPGTPWAAGRREVGADAGGFHTPVLCPCQTELPLKWRVRGGDENPW